MVVTAKYVLILLRADNNGEGGTLALMALASRALGGGRGGVLVILLGIISGALFYGDAIITPALSVLSAVEGLKVATPAFDDFVVPITVVILVVLVLGAVARHRQGRRFLRTRSRWFGSSPSPSPGLWHIGAKPDRAAGVQSLLRRALPAPSRHHRTVHARRGVPGGDRLGGALCRSRPFRPRADPHRLARGRAAGADDQLSRPGRAGAGQSEGDRESVLPAVSALGAAADGGCWRRPRR